MPVDMSLIGIEGHNAFHDNQYKEALSLQMVSKAQQEQREAEKEDMLMQIAQKASADYGAILRREQTAPNAPTGDITSPERSSADLLEMTAYRYAEAGAAETAADLFKKASDIRNEESMIHSRSAENRQREIESVIKTTSAISQLAPYVQDQAGLDALWDKMEAMQTIPPEMMEQLKSVPYSPEFMEWLGEQSMSLYQRHQLEFQAEGRKIQARDAENAQSYRERNLALSEARYKAEERHRAHQRKVGADSGVGVPSDNLVSMTKDLLTNKAPKGVTFDGAEAKEVINYVASEAQALLKNDKSLTADTAIVRAYEIALASGAISDEYDDGGWWGGESTNRKLRRDEGRTRESALTMPKAKTALIKHRYYVTPKGILQWNGRTFVEN